MAKKISIKGPIISNDEKWIYDWYEIAATSPNDVINELPTDNSPIEVVISSGGGSVYAGSEIYTVLKEYQGHTKGTIPDIAASAASLIAMGVDELQISPPAQVMIHNVSSVAQGDYRDLEHEAEVLKNFNTSIANVYHLKTGKALDELLEMMNKETWLTAQQALEHGFVDKIMFQDNTPSLVASMHGNTLPQNVIDKMRNMKDKLNVTSTTKEEPTEQELLNEQKQKLLMELDLI
jgi:ATP-dependent Clp protease protease subunit